MEEKKITNYEAQLRKIIINYPDEEFICDIEGIIIDYITKECCSIFDVFELNPHIYGHFLELSEENQNLFVKCVHDIMGDDEVSEINDLYRKKYLFFCDMLLSSERSNKYIDDEYELYNDNDLFIWHLSDIHFGKFYKKDYKPSELAQLLVDFTKGNANLNPFVILISGDITSTCKDEEFDAFIEFCKALSNKLWGKVIPENILLVPGNHDINWEDAGKNDKLEKFIRYFENNNVCICPFGKEENNYGDVKVHRYVNKYDDEPPITEVLYKKHGIRFLLLTSCYYSGEIPEKVLEYMKKNNITDTEFADLIRLDKGHLSANYLGQLYHLPDRENYYSFGLIHHNPIRYGNQTCESVNAEKLLIRLKEKRINILFHGHSHLAEKTNQERPHMKNQAYAIACPTLSSVPTSGTAGMNFYMLNTDDGKCMIKTATMSYDENDELYTNKSHKIYNIEIKDGNMTIC